MKPKRRSQSRAKPGGEGSARRWRVVFGGSPKTSSNSFPDVVSGTLPGGRRLGRAAPTSPQPACAPYSHFGVRVKYTCCSMHRDLLEVGRKLAGQGESTGRLIPKSEVEPCGTPGTGSSGRFDVHHADEARTVKPVRTLKRRQRRAPPKSARHFQSHPADSTHLKLRREGETLGESFDENVAALFASRRGQPVRAGGPRGIARRA